MNNEARLKTWNTYQSAWRSIGDDERRELLAQSVADDVVYTDPGSQVHGVDALAARIAHSQQTYPGAHFKNDSFLEHHDQGLFQWTMFGADDAVIARGASYGRFGDDGRLVQATGFFEPPKPK